MYYWKDSIFMKVRAKNIDSFQDNVLKCMSLDLKFILISNAQFGAIFAQFSKVFHEFSKKISSFNYEIIRKMSKLPITERTGYNIFKVPREYLF